MLGDRTFAAIGAAPGVCWADDCPWSCCYQSIWLHVLLELVACALNTAMHLCCGAVVLLSQCS